MNKLDYLAQKEEELRKLNEQLDQRKNNIMSSSLSGQSKQDPLDDSLDMRATKKNPFEEEKAEFRTSSTSLIKEA